MLGEKVNGLKSAAETMNGTAMNKTATTHINLIFMTLSFLIVEGIRHIVLMIPYKVIFIIITPVVSLRSAYFWLPQFQISVIPACPESFRKDSRRASLAGMTSKK